MAIGSDVYKSESRCWAGGCGAKEMREEEVIEG